MADSSLSSDLELEASPPRKKGTRPKATTGKRTGGSSRKSRKDKVPPRQDKDALRRNKAFERKCSKAQRMATSSLARDPSPSQLAPSTSADAWPPSVRADSPPLPPPARVPADSGHSLLRAKGVSQSMPDVSVVGLSASHRRRPEATFTPTADGLRDPEVPQAAPQLDLQAMFSSAISSLLAAGLQQASQIPLQPPAGQGGQEQLLSHLTLLRSRQTYLKSRNK